MPLCFDRHSFRQLPAKYVRGKSPVKFRDSDANCVEIGLVNNMPSTALETTERQFRVLLGAASGGLAVRLTLLALPDVPRTDAGRRHVSAYSDINELWGSHLDGLIVTGTEPRTPSLKEEPYWGSLTRLMEWAERHTYSSVWSCLAAHAAVFHIDGIARRPLSDKRFGVFECAKVSDHPLMAGVPARLHMPHSRWNDAPEDALTACGYRVLTNSNDAGADAFVKQRKSLFVFFQGHPEYHPATLLLEYRRDIGRFLRGERNAYPSMPLGYFDEDSAGALDALRERASTDRREELLRELPTESLASKVRHPWSSEAVCIYRNWLQYLCAQKARSLRTRQRRSPFRAAGDKAPEPVVASSAI
ncbi:MAG TPA: homoserine O-succinyltransferase [Bryobacteraceae bacterium]|nr:homoserine O-succinyltransferase [Bryobacteraceae bacterium]